MVGRRTVATVSAGVVVMAVAATIDGAPPPPPQEPKRDVLAATWANTPQEPGGSGQLAPSQRQSYPPGYTFLQEQPGAPGSPVRWNPCETITWSFPDGIKRHVRLQRKVFREVSKINGMTFRRTNTDAANISIVYADDLGPGVAGRGGFRDLYGHSDKLMAPRAGRISYKSSYRTNSPELLEKAFESRLFRHETGHVLGLYHTKGNHIMGPDGTGRDGKVLIRKTSSGKIKFKIKKATYSKGDRAGLRALGRGGCIEPVADPINLTAVAQPDGTTRISWTYPGQYPNLLEKTSVWYWGQTVQVPPGATSAVVAMPCRAGAQFIVAPSGGYGYGRTESTTAC